MKNNKKALIAALLAALSLTGCAKRGTDVPSKNSSMALEEILTVEDEKEVESKTSEERITSIFNIVKEFKDKGKINEEEDSLCALLKNCNAIIKYIDDSNISRTISDNEIKQDEKLVSMMEELNTKYANINKKMLDFNNQISEDNVVLSFLSMLEVYNKVPNYFSDTKIFDVANNKECLKPVLRYINISNPDYYWLLEEVDNEEKWIEYCQCKRTGKEATFSEIKQKCLDEELMEYGIVSEISTFLFNKYNIEIGSFELVNDSENKIMYYAAKDEEGNPVYIYIVSGDGYDVMYNADGIASNIYNSTTGKIINLKTNATIGKVIYK